MLDYPSLRAVAAIAQTGSFERAAEQLGVTPSAVSQRVKQLEERLGAALIVRGQPCIATQQGERLCRHMERVGMLEGELFDQLPGLSGQSGRQPPSLQIAVNADSLGTWLMPGLASYARESGHIVNVTVDDQDHTAEWLEKGKVLAAVTGHAKPVHGCRRIRLGALRYHATASPDYMHRHFPGGVDRAALARAPAINFNQKDRLQDQWIAATFGKPVMHQSHGLPSTHAFVDAALGGMGWGMNPAMLVNEHLKSGRLVELIAQTPIDVELYWQVSRLSAEALSGLTRAVFAVARSTLHQHQGN